MRKIAFNDNWLFLREGGNTPSPVVLPHDAMIWEHRDKNAPSQGAGAYFPGGVYTYTKEFSLPSNQWDTCLLELEGAYRDCSVFLNNNFVTSNHLGSLGFFADLTPYLQADKNRLEVKVSNDTQRNCRWYSGSGLYRPTWLWTGGPVHIPPDSLRLSTPEVSQEVSQIKLELQVVNRLRRQTTVRALVTLRDSKGDSVCTRNLPITLFPGENPSLIWNLYLRNGTLWSPDSPYLYTCTVELWQEEILLDSIQETFGLRHIQFDPVQGMRLNNHPIHLRGCCIHEDNGILGTADFASAVERKVHLLKEAGFNALRIAHQPATKNLLICCDKVGMLLLEESFDAWTHTKNVHDQGEHFSDQWLQVVDRIVAKDFNHPCVFAYSIGNEILEISQPDGIRHSRLLAQRFREKDPTRPVTNAINGIMSLRNSLADVLLDLKLITSDQLAALGESKKPGSPSIDINDTMTILQSSMDLIASHPLVGQLLEESFSHLDLCGYNYMMGRYDSDLATDPHRILFGSETTPPQIARLWENTQRSPGCLGDFTWTGWDYLGEAGVGCTAYDRKKDFGEPYPTYLAAVGDIDLTGHRLPISYYREISFSQLKFLSPLKTLVFPAFSPPRFGPFPSFFPL